MTLGVYVRREAEKRRRALSSALRAAKKAPTEEAIHLSRTSWRRLEAAVRLLPWLVDEEVWKPFRKRMRELVKCAAEARDRDIALGLVEGPAELRAAMEAQRELWRKAFVERLPTLLPVRLAFSGENDEELKGAAAALLREAEAKYARAQEKVTGSADTAKLHDFRIVAKRYRYALEFFDPKGKRVSEVKEVQDELGALQDRVAAIRVCELAAGDAELVAPLVGRLRQNIHDRIERLRFGKI